MPYYPPPSSGGAVATDAIFDAKGDLAVGTGADTAAKLTVGSNGQVPVADSGQTTGLLYMAYPDSLFQQALINGGFDVWQRNTTFTPNDDVFTADRWNFLTETNGAWTMARDTDVPAALGFKYSAKFSNVTLNNQCAIVQIIENVDAMKLDDKTVVLSFYAKTNTTEIANLRAAVLSWSSTADTVTSDVVGTWASDGTDPTWATNWTAENTPSNLALTSSWQRFTLIATIDTASMANFAVVIWVDDGTIAAADDFFITGVMVNEGSVALPYQPKTYEDELKACMRYCELFQGDATNTYKRFGNGLSYSTTVNGSILEFKVPKRTGIFTLTTSGTASNYAIYHGSDTVTACSAVPSISTNSRSKENCYILGTVASGLTAGAYGMLIANGTASAYLIIEAEL